MEKQEIKSLIVEYQEFVKNVKINHRPFEFEENANYVFVGMRRSGKSHLLYQIIQNKVKKEFKIEDILFINFEDERFAEATSKDLTLILDCYKELYDRKPIVFLDEIQVISGWQKFVRRLADTQYRVFVTGSNAEMLSTEIATTLGGRFIIQEVFPYSFSEFLNAHKIELQKNWEFSDLKNKVVQTAETYLEFGGLPEISQIKNKRPWLSGLYQKIFLGDIALRYSIRNEHALRLMIKKIADSLTSPLSLNRLANSVSSTGAKVGTATISEYIQFAYNSWLIFGISNYASAFGEKESIKKYYFSDNGILRLFLINDNAKPLENIVAIKLWKEFKENLYYFGKNIEVDFYIPSESLAIQVSYDISNAETLKREINAIAKLAEVFPVKKALLITNSEEKIIEENGLTIEILPIWKWLL